MGLPAIHFAGHHAHGLFERHVGTVSSRPLPPLTVIAMKSTLRACLRHARRSCFRTTSARWVVASLLSAASIGPALAANRPERESVDFYVVGGALRGLGETTWTAQTGFIYSPTTTPWGIGFVYTNDGHLTNNHRDGFAVQGWYVWPVSDRLEIQAGSGPYANMNNTTLSRGRENRFRVGLFTTLALKWHPFESGWYLRSQVTNTWVPGSFNSNAILFGAGYDFISTSDVKWPTRLKADISVWGGTSRTTQLGGQQTSGAVQIEAQYILDQPSAWWQPAAYSVAFLSEGDTGLVHRRGFPLQAWWRTPPDTITFSFGIGPYIAYDTYRDTPLTAMGILSIRAACKVLDMPSSAIEAAFMYTRVASFYHKDQDIFMLGVRLNAKR
jgi:hypothetical protein